MTFYSLIGVHRRSLFLFALLLAILLNGNLLLFLSAQEIALDHSSLRSFYFPLEQLQEPNVYHFQDIYHSNNDEYWHLHFVEKKNGAFLNIERYNHLFELIQKIEYQIEDTRSVLLNESCLLDNQIVAATIKKPTQFVWQNNLPTQHEASLLFESTDFNIHKNIKQNTQNTLWEKQYKGKSYTAILIKETYINSKQGFEVDDFSVYEQHFYFAQNIGLIEYKYIYADGQKCQHKLVDILGKTEWTNLKKKNH